MERFLDRAFAKVHGDVNKVQAETERNPDKADEEPVEEGAPAAIKRILKAWQDKEYFKLLTLPDPIADELGKPTWPCTAADVSRAYRKLSVLVHPDKNPGEEARAAFEALNETHRMLKDPGRLEEVLREKAGRARRERDRLDALTAAQSGHAHVVAAKNAATKRLRQQQGAALEDEIRQQMKKRVGEAQRRAEAVAKARATALHQQEGQPRDEDAGSEDEGAKKPPSAGAQGRSAAGSSRGNVGKKGNSENDSEDEEEVRRAALASAARKRRKPTMLH